MKTMTAANIIFILIVSFLAASCLCVRKLLGKEPNLSIYIDEERSFGGYTAYDYARPIFMPVSVNIPHRTAIIVDKTPNRRVAEVAYDFPLADGSGNARYEVIFNVRIVTRYSETIWIDMMYGQGDHYEHKATYSLRGNQDESQNALRANAQQHDMMRAFTSTELIPHDGGAQPIDYRIEGGVFVPGRLELESGVHTRLLRIQTTSRGEVSLYITPELVRLD